MWARLIGRLVCSLILCAAISAHGAEGNREIFSPWTTAPSCPAGKACIYMLSADGQLYVVDGNALTTKLHGAKLFRTSANCAALSGPSNGDVCYDTGLGYFRLYSGGWKTIPTAVTSPLSLSGQTISLTSNSVVYAAPIGGHVGVLGAAATLYLRAPGMAASGTVNTTLGIAVRVSTARTLRCVLGIAPGGADSVTVTVQKNGIDTAISCAITGAGLGCIDGTNTAALALGDTLSLKAVSTAATASDLSCLFEVTN